MVYGFLCVRSRYIFDIAYMQHVSVRLWRNDIFGVQEICTYIYVHLQKGKMQVPANHRMLICIMLYVFVCGGGAYELYINST